MLTRRLQSHSRNESDESDEQSDFDSAEKKPAVVECEGVRCSVARQVLFFLVAGQARPTCPSIHRSQREASTQIDLGLDVSQAHTREEPKRSATQLRKLHEAIKPRAMFVAVVLGAAAVVAAAAPRRSRADFPKEEYIVNIPGLGTVAGITSNTSTSVAFFGGVLRASIV
jgi:hypothetical protein